MPKRLTLLDISGLPVVDNLTPCFKKILLFLSQNEADEKAFDSDFSDNINATSLGTKRNRPRRAQTSVAFADVCSRNSGVILFCEVARFFANKRKAVHQKEKGEYCPGERSLVLS